MKKSAILILTICASIVFGYAQSDIDAFTFSQVDWSGTARFTGVGGAFGAVGAEFSALSTNPASIGVFKKNEVTFTPLVISIFKSTSIYNDNHSSYLASNYNLANVGLVFSFTNITNQNIKGLQFGFGYNRICDYNNQFRVEGVGANTSMMDEYVAAANSSNELGLFNTNLAWNTWLLDYDSTESRYYSPLEKQPLTQSKYVHTKGAADEMIFSFGGNINDNFYFGATIGVPFLEYHEKVTYNEYDDLDTIGAFDEFTAHYNSSTEGIGINLKIGVLCQPADFVRFGMAFHTPTYYGKLKNTYDSDIYAKFNGKSYNDESPEGVYNYKLTTPLRVMGNVAFFIKKRAFISAEYEYTNFALAQMYAYGNTRYTFGQENQAIKDKYTSQHVVRLGGEVRITDIFLMRLGYIYKSSPYKKGDDGVRINDGSSHTGSLGLGFRAKRFFCDITYLIKRTKESFWIYSPEFVNSAANTYHQHRIVATAGVKF